MASSLAVNKKSEDSEEDNESINSKDVKNESEDIFNLEKYLEVNTEFLYACEHNDIDGEFGVKYWISQGADVNYWSDLNFDEDGSRRRGHEFGLHYVATRNYPELCDFLLSQPNIDVNMSIRHYDSNFYTDPPLK